MKNVTMLQHALTRVVLQRLSKRFSPLRKVSGAVSKTLTALIERVKLVIQNQVANPRA